MNHRHSVLLPAKTLAADATETLSLKGASPISEIVVLYKGTNNGSVPTEHPAKLVTKVEVVDGSEVLSSLSGIQAVAMEYFHYGQPGLHGVNYIDNNQCWVCLRIPFGRWLWDRDFAFDPARYANPQLIISTDLDGGGAAPDAGSLEVSLGMFDELAISPIGHLVNKQVYSYAMSSSGVQTIDLPSDRTIKSLMIQSLARTKAPNQQYNNIKLSQGYDRRVPIDNSTSDLIKMLGAGRAPYIEGIRGNATTSAVALYIGATYEDRLIGPTNILASLDTYGMTNGGGGKWSIDAETGGEYDALAQGYCPLGAFAIDFGDAWDPTDWLTPKREEALQLIVTAGSSVLSSSTCQIVLQQLKKYGG